MTQTKLALLLISMLTVMSGTAIVASLPMMSQNFADIENITLFSKLMLTLPAIFVTLAAPFSGAIADRIGRIRPIWIGLVFFIVGGSSGVYLNDLYALLIGRALLGIGVAFLMTGSMALIGDYFQGEERHRFMGMQAAFNSLGGIIFIAGGGFLAEISWRLPFAIYVLPLLFLPLVYVALQPPKITFTHDASLDSKLFEPKLVGIYITAFLLMTLFYILPTQVPFLLIDHFGQSPSSVGVLIAFAMGISILGSMNYRKVKAKLSYKQIFMLLISLFGLGLFLMSQASSMKGFFFGAAFTGMGLGFMMVNLNAWVLDSAAAHIRGKVLGLTMAFSFLGQFVSPIIFEMIISYVGVQGLFFYLGIGLLLLPLIMGALF